jgi:hypothetical protein
VRGGWSEPDRPAHLAKFREFHQLADAAQARAARQRATVLYRLRRFTPRHAARDILRAVQRDAAIAPITVEAKAGLLASRLTPGLLRALAKTDFIPR